MKGCSTIVQMNQLAKGKKAGMRLLGTAEFERIVYRYKKYFCWLFVIPSRSNFLLLDCVFSLPLTSPFCLQSFIQVFLFNLPWGQIPACLTLCTRGATNAETTDLCLGTIQKNIQGLTLGLKFKKSNNFSSLVSCHIHPVSYWTDWETTCCIEEKKKGVCQSVMENVFHVCRWWLIPDVIIFLSYRGKLLTGKVRRVQMMGWRSLIWRLTRQHLSLVKNFFAALPFEKERTVL